MSSNYKSDAFVGADWYEVGRMLADDVVKQCGTGTGKSGKVQIVQGELTAAASVDQIGGIMDVFNKDPAIKVVSNQAANWDANTALNITATVIQQHPDLCASVGFWGIMESGAAQAIRNAGKIDQVKVYASGEGSQLDCDQVNQGNFYKFLSYKATEQGHDLVSAAVTLAGRPARSRDASTSRISRSRSGSTRPTPAARNCFALPKAEVAQAGNDRPARVAFAGGGSDRVDGERTSMSIRQPWTPASRTRLRASLLAAAIALGTAAEAVVRAGDSLHGDDRLAALFRRRRSRLCRTVENFLSLMRLFAEFGFVALGDGVLPDHRRHRSQRRRHLRALQFRRAVLPVRRSSWPVWLVIVGHAGGRRCARRHQRLADRLSQGAAVSHHAGDADHPARLGQSS